MLQELSDESRRMGLKMNIAKTKVMVVDNTPKNVNNVLIENVEGYGISSWTNTDQSDTIWQRTAQYRLTWVGDSRLRPSPIHETLWRPNDEDLHHGYAQQLREANHLR